MKALSIALGASLAACAYFPGDDSAPRNEYDPVVRADATVVGTSPDAAVSSPDAQPPPDAAPVEPACTTDAQCGADVCSFGSCVAPSTVRDVTVTWTYNGYPGSAYTCSTAGVSTIKFSFNASGAMSVGSVSCSAGSYVIRHVPVTTQYLYTTRPGRTYGECYYIPGKHWIDPNGVATFDLKGVDTYDYCGL